MNFALGSSVSLAEGGVGTSAHDCSVVVVVVVRSTATDLQAPAAPSSSADKSVAVGDYRRWLAG